MSKIIEKQALNKVNRLKYTAFYQKCQQICLQWLKGLFLQMLETQRMLLLSVLKMGIGSIFLTADPWIFFYNIGRK